ncbi:hypothetical protein [Acetobacter peroxydans]|uniref:Twin-arginine translocation signal domain-containing protein n=1 Tax=Acetobacter peroxydans TaxID=104098 RepID=A0A4Y3TY05_9PROT|nr:hypothetical protein [Acetobacter peroxydans]NHO17233.1 hypothetical protein [Acetobacter peroxydans]GBR38283.1 hypothetical protein AA13755_2152 [Acetobacter peroxydans NBRC 13755]GBR40218.1 hypothetical protein AA0475_0533 [Acetobacter peroxydans]GEB86329.1 hypothetical protein APE01nite_21260 [Acetobacter peroxydans]
MSTLSRRSFLRSAALVGATALTACTVTTTNGVTTITLDVTKVKNYGQAGLNAAATVTSFLSSFPALAPYALAITAAETALSGALSAFSSAAGSTLTISYNDATWKTRVDSILSDLDTLAAAIESALSGSGAALSSSVLSNARTAYNALATLISVFKALLGVPDAKAPVGTRTRLTRDMVLVGAPVPATGMTEAQALKALGV